MTDTTTVAFDIKTLPARLAMAVEPSRDLDMEIALAVGWMAKGEPGRRLWIAPGETQPAVESDARRGLHKAVPPAFTTDWNAAISLAARSRLQWEVGHYPGRAADGEPAAAAAASPALMGNGPWHDGQPARLPICALLAAVVRAIARKEWTP